MRLAEGIKSLPEVEPARRAGEELDYESRIHSINDYVEDRIDHFEPSVAGTGTVAGGQDRQLYLLFRAALQEAWGMPQSVG